MSEPLPDPDPLLPGTELPAASWPDSPHAAALRAALLDRTLDLVRARTRARRFRVAAGWLGAYAAGLATAWLALSQAGPARPDAPRGVAIAQVAQPQAVDQNQAKQIGTSTGNEADDEASLPPDELRRRVADAPRSEQLRLLRLAGDRYLYDAADVQSALDCYRQILELTLPEARGAVGPDDSWLLAELKWADLAP
ncbi:MAG TPA: hypothetical protein VGX78_04075 [Pirellulales bacterium]|nr:hypothetical protein [Pirellulales bacterium]